MRNNMKISVVVPIYKVEKFLPDCLDSLVSQSRHDFEVFMIDDGSPDKSGEIAKKYAKKHANFHYFYQNNEGLGGARNAGLSLVNSDYVVFIDSDDFVGPKYIENINKKIDELGDFDIGLTMPAVYDTQTDNYWDYMDADIIEDIFKNDKITNSKKSPAVFSIEANFPRCVWSVKFLRNNNFAFEKHIKWEDIEPHFTLFHAAEKIAYLDFDGGYYYRINSGGGQITSLTGAGRLDMIHVFDSALSKADNWSNYEYVHFLRVMVIYSMWTLNVIDEEYRKAFVKGISKVFKKIKLKHYFEYRKLQMPYRPYNKRFVISLILRSSLLRGLFYKRKTTDRLHKLWKKVRGK